MSHLSYTPRTILVTGGTGYVGGRLVPELLERGDNVRCLARRPKKLRNRSFAAHPRFTIGAGDVLDHDSVVRLARGCDVAYYLVHSLGSGADFASIDHEAAATFARACHDAGVQRIVYLSGLGDSAKQQLSEHLHSRQRTGDALRSAGVPVTELRAGIIIGSGSQSFEIIHDLARKLPLMIAPRWINSLTEPIAIRDVVAYLIGVLDEPRTAGRTFEIGNGERMPYRKLIEICAEEMGRRARIVTVPVLTPTLSSYWLHLVTSVDKNVARPLIEGLRNDSVATEHAIRDLVPIVLTSYREALQRAFRRRSDTEVRWSAWTDASRNVVPAAIREHAHLHGTRTYSDEREFHSPLSPSELFDRVERIGGSNGYGGGLDGLWRLRGLMDRVAGGPGLRRERPRVGSLSVGDPVDFWRVSHIERPRSFGLEAEMLVPGVARLEFRVSPAEDGTGGSRLIQSALLVTDSWRGSAYWWSVWPFHHFVFSALGRWIAAPDRNEPVVRQLDDGTWELTATTDVPRPIDEVFDFFSNAHNLERITPAHLGFRVLAPAPVDMHEGTVIDYRLRIRGVPVRWRSRISEWQPGRRFVDEQLRGPYRSWRHEHEFESLGPRETRVRDRVTFRVPVDRVLSPLVVRDVRDIFRHRARVLDSVLATQ